MAAEFAIRILDKALADVPRSKIRDQLIEVGFDYARQAEIVGGLSGGWKMKLELARAMLYNADLLLLDEVSIFTVVIIQFTERVAPIVANKSCMCVSVYLFMAFQSIFVSWIALLSNGSNII